MSVESGQYSRTRKYAAARAPMHRRYLCNYVTWQVPSLVGAIQIAYKRTRARRSRSRPLGSSTAKTLSQIIGPSLAWDVDVANRLRKMMSHTTDYEISLCSLIQCKQAEYSRSRRDVAFLRYWILPIWFIGSGLPIKEKHASIQPAVTSARTYPLNSITMVSN